VAGRVLMSKINQIQKALLELDGGAFQKLADNYLHKKGYEHINSLGSVIGSDKVRKGTPDTWVTLPSGKYIFAEYTTQKEEVFEKIKNDLEKCFDESKTKVSVEKIEEVVFCHLSVLEPSEEQILREQCQDRGVNLNIFGIGPISYDLLEKYPGIAKDHLRVEVDTGQILDSKDFVTIYNKNKRATRLDTAFQFRKDEVELVLESLETVNLIIIVGRPGVGKSRLALECCRQFKELQGEYEIQCIFNRGLDLFEDLRVHFSEPGKFLIFVDDANRTNQFSYIIHLLQDQRANQQIKVIVTVRDYALDRIRDTARSYGEVREIVLEPLKEEQIRQLVKAEYKSLNPIAIDRIADIAQGNPRLAIMAAIVAKETNRLASISDVSALYDQYFASIREDLIDFQDRNLLKVAGSIIFFRAVDISNEKMMNMIEQVFKISPTAFSEAARKLNSMEIVDMYENEVVKVSDQVLATYLFYLIFFKEEWIEFSVLLEHFFPHFRNHLVDSLNPTLSAFYSEVLIEKMRPSIDRLWKSFQDAGNEEGLLHLMEVFFFIKQTESLLYIRNYIAEMPVEPLNLSTLEFKPNSNLEYPSILRILGFFQGLDEPTFRIALTNLFSYVGKRPTLLPQLLFILLNWFGFKHRSYIRNFMVQRAVLDVLWQFVENGKNEFFSRIFLCIIAQFLQIHFHTTEDRGRHRIAIINFELPSIPEIFELRKLIWSRLLHLHRLPAYRKGILNILHEQITVRYTASSKEIMAHDALVLLPFVESELNPEDYQHCSVTQKYLALLDSFGIGFNAELWERFRHETNTLATLLLTDWEEIEFENANKANYDEFQRLKRKRIEEHFVTYDLENYKQFFEQCLGIFSNLEYDHECSLFYDGVTAVLLNLAHKDPELYAIVLEHYLKSGELFKLQYPIDLVVPLIKSCGAARANEILVQPDYPTKQVWLFAYYRALPIEEITSQCLSQLYILYDEAEPEELPYGFDYLLNYHFIDEEVVARVTEIILDKPDRDLQCARILSTLFTPRSNINKQLGKLFLTNMRLLKRAYLAAINTNRFTDHHGQTLAIILNLDPDFVLEYVDNLYEGTTRYKQNKGVNDYSFLWLRSDYAELMSKVVTRIFEKKQSLFVGTNEETFFKVREGGINTIEVEARQDLFLIDLIKLRSHDSSFIEFLFDLISEFPPKRRYQFITTFLQYNKNFEDFTRLSLQPGAWSAWGSAVPVLQERVEYLETLLSILNTVDLLEHRQHIERKIQQIRSSIEREKKNNFMEDIH
jgi:hypothetical protein